MAWRVLMYGGRSTALMVNAGASARVLRRTGKQGVLRYA